MQCTARVIKYEGLARYEWQCHNQAKTDDKCGVHSDEAVARRQQKSDKRYEATKGICYACKYPYKEGRFYDRLVAALNTARQIAYDGPDDPRSGSEWHNWREASSRECHALLDEIRG